MLRAPLEFGNFDTKNCAYNLKGIFVCNEKQNVPWCTPDLGRACSPWQDDHCCTGVCLPSMSNSVGWKWTEIGDYKCQMR